MMPGSKGQNVVLACKIRHLNLGPAKHEEVAIYAVNLRIPNVYRIAGVICNGAIRRHLVGGKRPFDPNIIIYIRETR